MSGSISMKFARLTKESIWSTYTKFQMNQLNLGDVQNFKTPSYLTFSKPSSRFSTLLIFMHNCNYPVYSKIDILYL